MAAIEATGLRKVYGSGKDQVEALRGLDLHVAQGAIFGLLGPNGAGKTTTARVLTTLLTPSAGHAAVAGCDLIRHPEQVRRRIGYVAQSGQGPDPLLTARQELSWQARVFGLTRRKAARRTQQMIDRFSLHEYADRRAQSYSGGQRRRLDLALGLIHRPQLVFLDEPTTGLDPHARADVWDEVRRLRSEGLTVFVTTHYLEEADALCDEVAICDHGEIITRGAPGTLKQQLVGDRITLTTSGQSSTVAQWLSEQSVTHHVEPLGDNQFRAQVTYGETALLHLVRQAEQDGITLTSITLARPSLDDVFLAHTGRSLRSNEDQEDT